MNCIHSQHVQLYRNTLDTLSRKLRLVKSLSGTVEADPDILQLNPTQTPDSPILQADISVAKQVRICTARTNHHKKAAQHLSQISEISEITFHACEAGRCSSHLIGLLAKSLSNLDGSLISNDVVGTGVKSMKEKLQEYERSQNEMVSVALNPSHVFLALQLTRLAWHPSRQLLQKRVGNA